MHWVWAILDGVMQTLLRSINSEESTISISDATIPSPRCEVCKGSPRLRCYEGLVVRLLDRILRWEYRIKGWPALLTTYDHLLLSEKMVDRAHKLGISGVDYVPVDRFISVDGKEFKAPKYFAMKTTSWVKVYPPEGMVSCEACGYLTFLTGENIYGYKHFEIDESTWDGSTMVECENVCSRQRYLPEPVANEFLKGIKKSHLSGERLFIA
jgi:hypothetical protein